MEIIEKPSILSTSSLAKWKNLFIAVAGKNVLRRNLYKRSASLRNDFRPIYEYE